MNAMARFVGPINDRALASHDWPSFARGYNSPAYSINSYHAPGRNQRYLTGAAGPGGPLRAGVSALPSIPARAIDGMMGRFTRSATNAFQTSAGLVVTDLLDEPTYAALKRSRWRLGSDVRPRLAFLVLAWAGVPLCNSKSGPRHRQRSAMFDSTRPRTHLSAFHVEARTLEVHGFLVGGPTTASNTIATTGSGGIPNKYDFLPRPYAHPAADIHSWYPFETTKQPFCGVLKHTHYFPGPLNIPVEKDWNLFVTPTDSSLQRIDDLKNLFLSNGFSEDDLPFFGAFQSGSWTCPTPPCIEAEVSPLSKIATTYLHAALIAIERPSGVRPASIDESDKARKPGSTP
jgi:hypothetical protein